MVIPEIRDKVRTVVTSKRFEHILGVAETAAMLGTIYDVDPVKCEIAGLLHDCAKCYADDELLRMCDDAGIFLSNDLRSSPQLLHAVYGPTEAAVRYGITDNEILSSIRYHTTGKKNMTRLEQIVFVADYIEPHRDKAKDLTTLRILSVSDIDLCTAMILRDTIEYLTYRKTRIDTDTLEAFEFYKKHL